MGPRVGDGQYRGEPLPQELYRAVTYLVRRTRLEFGDMSFLAMTATDARTLKSPHGGELLLTGAGA